MYQESIKYTDYNGVEREETFYFNLTEAELLDMELTTAGGFANVLQQIIDAKDVPAIANIFKTLILKAYGKKSDDGRRFLKSEAITEEFTQTEAFSMLYMRLATDTEYATNFVNSIVPKKLSDQMKNPESLPPEAKALLEKVQ